MSPLRIVQIETRKGRRERFQYRHQVPACKLLPHLALEEHREPQPGQREPNEEYRVSRENTRRNGDREVAPILCELPPVGRRVRRRMPIEALVVHQLARVLRLAVSCEIGRGTHDQKPKIAGYGDRNHVSIDHFAEMNAGIVAARHDVSDFIRHRDVELDVGVRREELREELVAEEPFGTGGHDEPKRAAWVARELPQRGDGRTDFQEFLAGTDRSTAHSV